MSLVLSFSTRGIADTRGGVTHAGAERGLSLGSPDVEDATCYRHLPASRAHLARRCCEEASLHAIAKRAEGPHPTPRSLSGLARHPSTPSIHAQRRHARGLARLARPARAARRPPRAPSPAATVPGDLQ